MSWRETDILKAIEQFRETHGRLPNSNEFCSDNNLPSKWCITHRYGGYNNMRVALGYGKSDLQSYKSRSKTGKIITSRAVIDETTLYDDMVAMFGEDNVSTQPRIYRDSAETLDIRVNVGNTILLIDVFHGKNRRSIIEGLRKKRNKYNKEQDFYTKKVDILFVYVTEDDCAIEIDGVVPYSKLAGLLSGGKVR